MNILQTLGKIIAAPIIAILAWGGYAVIPADRLPLLENQLAEQGNLIELLQNRDEAVELGAFSPSGGGTYRLRSSAGSTDTIIRLSSFKEPISNIKFTMTYLGTDKGYGTLDPNLPTKSEFVSFSGITQNSDGTADLTGITRGLTRTPGISACTASTTLASSHPGQSIFILSDSPCLFKEFAIKSNNEVVTGNWEVPYPTASSSIASRGFVLNTVASPATVSFDKTVVGATAGETIATGTILSLSSGDGRWYLANASSTSASDQSLLGIAQGAGTAGVAISGGALIKGLDTTQIGLTTGANYFLSTTAGATSTATTTRGIGRAVSTTQLLFDSYAIEHPVLSEKTAIQRLASSTQSYALSLATTTSHQAVFPSPAWTTYTQGATIRWLATATSTATTTLNVSALGQKTIVHNDGTSLTGSEYYADQIVQVNYDGTNFRLAQPSGWTLLGKAEATDGAQTSLSVANLPHRNRLKIEVFMPPTNVSNATTTVRFNNVSSTQYAFRYSRNGAADVQGNNGTFITLDNDNLGRQLQGHFEIANATTSPKLLMGESVSGINSAVYAPDRQETVGLWNNASRITRIDLMLNASTTPTFGYGSYISVYGSD